jgi:cobalamin biosynthesis Co2+ chelatase CbiK
MRYMVTLMTVAGDSIVLHTDFKESADAWVAKLDHKGATWTFYEMLKKGENTW